MSKVITRLEQIQADSIVMYAKVHNYHWNVKGMNFLPIHQMTETMYNSIAILFDDCAERILQLGQKPIVTLADSLSRANIVEDSGLEFSSEYVLTNILKDYKYLLDSFKILSDDADDDGDKGTVSFADDKIAVLEKEIWMIESSLK
jgi:starvation-inducible DNA-binding protein